MAYEAIDNSVARSGQTGYGASVNRALAARAYSNNEGVFRFDGNDDVMAKWAAYGGSADTRTPHSYFDYFFSGQDIQVLIDGLEKPEDDVPIIEFGFNIQQNKQPLYGFWDYKYRHMLHGTRIVTGAFRIVTKGADYMTKLVAKAANRRATGNAEYTIRDLDEDEANVERYWGRNLDYSLNGEQHLFSIHPPFNFVIVYGVQSTSLSDNYTSRATELKTLYNDSTAYFTDVNERLIDADPINSMRVVVENVTLTGMQQEIDSSGMPITELYSFIASDLRYPDRQGNTSGPVPTNP